MSNPNSFILSTDTVWRWSGPLVRLIGGGGGVVKLVYCHPFMEAVIEVKKILYSRGVRKLFQSYRKWIWLFVTWWIEENSIQINPKTNVYLQPTLVDLFLFSYIMTIWYQIFVNLSQLMCKSYRRVSNKHSNIYLTG